MELDLSNLSDSFKNLLTPLAGVTPRPEIRLTQIPSPQGIAPESFALAAEIDHQTASDHGVSRLVLCCDYSEPEGWNGPFRFIGYAKSPIEVDLVRDDYSSQLPWEWLRDSLSGQGASFSHEAGTTTTVLSTGHGSLLSQPQHAELEIRASWAPMDADFRPHLLGWIELLAMISGLPPIESKVTRIR